MKVSQTKLELLENTIAYYSEDTSRRALEENGDCQYLTACGNRCAIGREMRTDALDEIKNESIDGVMHLLPKRLQAMGEKFLTSIQNLHDTSHFWDDHGLTISGKRKVQELKDRYEL